MQTKVFTRLLLTVGLGVLLATPRVYADPLDSIAKKLAKGTKTLKNKRIAILVFPYDNGYISSGSSIVSEQLTTLLADRRGVQVIERAQLANVLSEVKLEESGVVASSGTDLMGEVSDVDAVVTGTLQDLRNEVTVVNARLIRIPTGEVLAAAMTKIDRSWDDAPHAPPEPDSEAETANTSYGQIIESPLIFTPTARSGRPAPPPPEMVELSPAQNTQPVAYSQTGSGPATAVYVINQPVHRPHRRNPPLNNQRAQLLYAMGLTLDAQGHHKQAARFLQASAAPAPLPAARQAPDNR